MTERRDRDLGVALALLSAATFAAGPVGAKLAFADGASVLTVVTLRGAVAAILAAGLIAGTGGGFRFDRRAWGWGLCGGAFQSALVYALLAAVTFVPVGVAVLVFFSHPFLLAVLAGASGRERLTTRRALAAVAAAGGLALVLLPGGGTADPRGLGLAALAAAAMCGVVLCAVRAQEHAGSAQVNLVSTATSAAGFALLALTAGGWALPEGVPGWSGVLLAGLGIGVGLLAFLAALRRIGPVRASMLATVEPLLGAMLAAAILGEVLGAAQWIGAAVAVVALVIFEGDARAPAKDR